MKLTYFSKKGSYVLLSTLLLIASCGNDKNSAEIKDNGLPKAKEKLQIPLHTLKLIHS